MSRNLQKMIHVGCRELGLDAEARRDLQLAACGKGSMRDMSEADLEKVVARLKTSGFKPGFKASGKKPAAPRADLRLIHVLWKRLGQAGVLERPDRAGLNAFVRVRFEEVWGSVPADVDMMRDHAKIDAVIQALKSWARRAEVPLDRKTPR
ncbi:regulatory protein GemA [Limimaricola variabilis]|uniref:gp16 family protein n=1 Tax=Limimaricola variabilis TaxID=1492771 RepID=UPI002AC960B3|nr:regulatory protein GemA [Limimaricola variabilis]WPY94699.1 regulatory protein GemA [Limimaricola variabilis]